jgi:cell division protein FtsA
MSRRPQLVTGIDIGSRHVRVVLAERAGEKGAPRIIGRGSAESKGLRHGYIVNIPDVVRSVRAAVGAAERAANARITRAYLAIGGIGLEGTIASGSTIVTRADSEITEVDVTLAHNAAEGNIPAPLAANRKVIHAVPLQYKIDNKDVLGRPLGMRGMKLEAKLLFITTLEQHVNDLIEAVELAGVEVLDVMASPLSASFVTLTAAQKIAGCVLANIGAETLSTAVFEDGIPISLHVFPLGSTDVTNDIALGFKISLENAEELKHGSTGTLTYPEEELRRIIRSRLAAMFELVEAHLKKIGRAGMLPAGIVITGGGSAFSSIEELARSALRLPSRVALPNLPGNTQGELRDSAWSVAYGLCLWGLAAEQDEEPMGIRMARRAKNKLLDWLKQFLP